MAASEEEGCGIDGDGGAPRELRGTEPDEFVLCGWDSGRDRLLDFIEW
jgi:hypothetical protein